MTTFVACPYCGALGLGIPPHGLNNPCPLKVRLDEATIANLDAQRMSSIRSSVGMENTWEATTND